MGRIKDVAFDVEESLSTSLLKSRQISQASYWAKRIFDVVGSVLGLVLLSPLYLLIAALVKWEDNGPVLYRQERIGYHGKPFILYKFRSMTVTAESGGKPVLCSKNDKRLTRVGQFLREHHLDELPQLWNVLKGEMSFVGPRPERRFFIEQIIAINPDYQLLYKLRPGLFSAATLYNGYTDTMDKMLIRLRMDLLYLAHQSLWVDLRIICLTVWAILSGKKF